MACAYPIKMFQLSTGGKLFKNQPRTESGFLKPGKWLDIGCGQCLQCRIARKAEWNLKLTLEHRACDEDCCYFGTLTYDEENLPMGGDFFYRDVQLFLKRLRFEMAKPVNGGYKNIRFFVVGERGEQGGRPHYHFLLFNLKFPDLVPYGVSRYGTREVRSKSALLDRLWGKGLTEVGSVTQHSISYCANYVVDKINGKAAEKHYERVDRETGEVFTVGREFSRMSNRPGIGAAFYEKYKADFSQGYAIHPVLKAKVPVPTSFKRKLKAVNPEQYDSVVKRNIAQFEARDEAMRMQGDSVQLEALRKEHLVEIKIAKDRVRRRMLDAKTGGSHA